MFKIINVAEASPPEDLGRGWINEVHKTRDFGLLPYFREARDEQFAWTIPM